MSIIHVDEKQFKKEIESNDIVLIDFFATWCGPCNKLEKVLEEFSNENEDITILKVNVNEQEELAIQYNIMNIPTLVVLKNGEEYKRSEGLISKNKIMKLLI